LNQNYQHRQPEQTSYMQKPPDNFIIAPPKRYWVAQTRTTKYFSISTIPEIAALLNAKLISEDFMATEHNRFVHSYDKVLKNEAAVWVKVSELLAEAYKDQPLVTVVLKDIENNAFILSERYHSNGNPRSVAAKAVSNYFDQHYKEFERVTPKEFLVYFKGDKYPASKFNFKLIFKPETHLTGTTDSKHAPFEETYPYTFKDSESYVLEPPAKFPSVSLELKPPQYDPTSRLQPEFRSPVAT